MSINIGFIGLGKMGMPMAKNLLDHGFNVYGTDVDEEALVELRNFGAKTGKLSNWIHDVEYIILMLPSSKIVNRVIEDIVASYSTTNQGMKKPLTLVDMSSSYPTDTRRNAEILEQQHINLVDAPVSGGVSKAINGTLTIMVGGELPAFEKCKRFLTAMGENIFHVGPIGSGHLIKAINNYLSATHLLASCEAVQLLEFFNVNPETAINVINQSSGRSGSTEFKFPNFILNDAYNSGFSLELLKKDVEMASQLFLESDAATSLPNIIAQKYKEASNALVNEADHTEINRFVSTYLIKRGISNEENEKNVFRNSNPSISN